LASAGSYRVDTFAGGRRPIRPLRPPETTGRVVADKVASCRRKPATIRPATRPRLSPNSPAIGVNPRESSGNSSGLSCDFPMVRVVHRPRMRRRRQYADLTVG
jgi:hypothetical protein